MLHLRLFRHRGKGFRPFGCSSLGRRLSAPLLLSALLTLAPTVGASGSAPAGVEDYEALMAQRYSSPFTVPAEGLTLERDTARWHLASGTVRLLAPTSGGHFTGLVFEGEGLFEMEIPDPLERESLARLGEDPTLDRLDTSFGRLLLRTSEPLLHELLPAEWLDSAAGFGSDPLARDRQEHLLVKRGEDVDARVVVGLATPGDRYLRVELDSRDHGWLGYLYDSQLHEEIALMKFQKMNEFTELWVGLDRAEDRTPEGRFNDEAMSFVLDIEHVALDIDITDRTTQGSYGRAGASEVRGRFTARLRAVSEIDGLAALPLTLAGRSEVTAVRDTKGRELSYIRDHRGKRSAGIDNDVWDSSLVVLLAEPLAEGKPFEVEIDYVRDLVSYVPGRSWYPGQRDGLFDPHTGELSIVARSKWEVRSIGELVEKRQGDDKTTTWVWRMDEPTVMLGFSFADRFHEKTFEVEGIPKVVSFSPPVSNQAKTMVHNVGADVANSLGFFTWLFGPLDVPTIQVTGIPAGHGQAFEGFIHMSEFTFYRESSGGELFRAHEVAHQWWGHEVGWASYRDQWLSESFAEYASMMYLEAVVEGGKKMYTDVLRAYTDMLLSKRVADFNRFARPWLVDLDTDHRERLGPIAMGGRASTCEMPGGYTLQAYFKGPMVLHMMRHVLRAKNGKDELFVTILRDFVAQHRGGQASTADFQRVVEQHAGGSWDWFFDQWIYGNHIPSYEWSYQVGKADDGRPLLELTVEQSGVPEGFVMPIPVRVEFGGGQGGTIRVNVSKPRETFRMPLPKPAKKVIFNPDFAVLANVSKG